MTFAVFNIIAVIGGFVVLLLNLQITFDITKKVKPDTSSSVTKDIVTIQVISVVTSVVIFVVYTCFMYANIKSIRIFHYWPKKLLYDKNNENFHNMVRLFLLLLGELVK